MIIHCIYIVTTFPFSIFKTGRGNRNGRLQEYVCRLKSCIRVGYNLVHYSSWEDTKDPAACNTNPNVYMKFSRDPERTPFQWDGSNNAGFSKAVKTWLPVNPNYVELNLENEKASGKSHFKFYQKLMELRGLETFQYGDFKILALNQHVFAYVRELLDSDTYVVLINIGGSSENVSLKAFASLRPKLKVVASSPASDYEEG